jgi:hypothetical protein
MATRKNISRRKNMRGCGKKRRTRRYKTKSFRKGRRSMKGGNHNALTGAPWSPGTSSNHYSLNNYKSQIDYNTGSERTTGGSGSLLSVIPSDIANIGNVASYSANSFYNGVVGLPNTISPLPWVQKL